MTFKNLLPLALNLFDGAAGAAGGQSGTGTAESGTGSDTGETQGTAVPGRTRRGKTGETQSVVYGKQTADGNSPAAGESSAEPKADTDGKASTLEERRKAYRELVNGEYKDIYTEETQRILNRRFSETKTLQSTVDQQKPLIDLLAQRYNVADGDIGKLMTAIESDNRYWEAAAEEAGMTVDQYKNYQKALRENAVLKSAQESRKRDEVREQQVQRWLSEADEVAKKFKSFDFNRELENPDFVKLLQKGNPVEHAYKVLHFDELIGDAIGTTQAYTEKRVAENIRARGSRPTENGTSSQSAFTVKDDVHKLTKKDRAEIARRAARGEKISF